MKKLKVTYNDVVRYYENVTKVQFFGYGDFFESYFVIYQGKKEP